MWFDSEHGGVKWSSRLRTKKKSNEFPPQLTRIKIKHILHFRLLKSASGCPVFVLCSAKTKRQWDLFVIVCIHQNKKARHQRLGEIIIIRHCIYTIPTVWILYIKNIRKLHLAFWVLQFPLVKHEELTHTFISDMMRVCLLYWIEDIGHTFCGLVSSHKTIWDAQSSAWTSCVPLLYVHLETLIEAHHFI